MANRYETGDSDLLIVDDDLVFRTFYRDVLRRRGYTTEEASDRKQAFRFTNTNRYGLVITDLRMPNWDGFDFIVSAGTINPNQKILVIDQLTPELIRELEGLEDDGYIVGCLKKPVSEVILLTEVAKHVKPSSRV